MIVQPSSVGSGPVAQAPTSAGLSSLTIGELAFEVPVLSPLTSIMDVDRMLRRDLHLRAVILRAGTHAVLLTREQVDNELSGPFGYGRSIHARAVASDLVSEGDIVLAGTTTLIDAAEVALAREPEVRYRDILIRSGDTFAVVAVSRIFHELSILFRHVAFHDPLTGLPNRRLLDQHGHGLANRDVASRIAILYIDLDGFKVVNDTFGHKAGDEILIEFGRRLQACVRPRDVIARLGGDEFAALLTDVSDDQARSIADRVVLTASAPFVHDGHILYLSASVGLAMAEDVSPETELSELDVLLRHADGAMLHSKRTGKQRVTRLRNEHAVSTGVGRTNLIRRRLGTALESGDGLSLHYQQQLELSTANWVAVEALLRWTDPELGPVSPAEFIPIAEETEHIHRLGEWVVEQACAQSRRWCDEGTPRRIAVNISPVQFAHGRVSELVFAFVNAYGLKADLLRVEITESSALTDLPAAITQLRDLDRAGIGIELDDFGVGHSSLSRLRQLPLTTIKIDKSLIDNIDRHPSDAVLLGGIITTGHALGLSVTAEGVERAEQLAVLRELGCDTAQGFLIARPMAADQIERTTRSNRGVADTPAA